MTYPVIGVLGIMLIEQHIKVAVGALCVCASVLHPLCVREREATGCVGGVWEVGVVGSDYIVDLFLFCFVGSFC